MQGRCPGRLCHVQNVRVRPGRLCHVPNVRVRPGRLCHVPNVRVRPGRLCHVPNVRVRPGRLCYVLDVRVRVRVWYRFWFHYGIKHRFKYVITSNIWCVAAWSDGRALDCSVGGPVVRTLLSRALFFDYIIEDKVFEKILSSNTTVY